MGRIISKQRVGILTFHRAINFGAILQAYALQETLKNMGCQAVIIDYRSPEIEHKHKHLSLFDCRGLTDLARFLLYSRSYNKKYLMFRRFAAVNLDLSDSCDNTNQLKRIAPEFEKFISGSDQVWNYKIANFDTNYFLEFVKESAKKNSYAASFGVSTIPQELAEKYRLLLVDFNKISVREEQGKRIISNLLDREAELVLDPTMLLLKNEWEKKAVDNKDGDYILLYTFGNSEAINKFAEDLSRKTRNKIVYISYSRLKRIKASYQGTIGPAEFLGLFKNARYVVTNSFHGVCFSLIFNKEFFVEALPERLDVNSRLDNILNLFSLQSRRISKEVDTINPQDLDYDKINAKMLEERQRSFNFIKEILSG